MSIQIDYTIATAGASFNIDDIEKFICEAAVEGVTAEAMALAPELAGADVFADVEFTSECSKIGQGSGSSSSGVGDGGGTPCVEQGGGG